MTTAANLVGLGVPAEVAKRTGWTAQSVTATTTTQGTGGGNLAAAKENKLVLATLTVGQSITLPASAEIGQEIKIFNLSAAAGVVYPPTGETLNQLAANTATAIVANGALECFKVSATAWRVIPSAAIA